MSNRTCTVVLVGEHTASRKWINYEIIKSWNDGLGVVGIRIHGLQARWEETTPPGANPFDFVHFVHNNKQEKLSQIVKCHAPTGATSTERYGWIKKHLGDIVEGAIEVRKRYD